MVRTKLNVLDKLATKLQLLECGSNSSRSIKQEFIKDALLTKCSFSLNSKPPITISFEDMTD